MRNKYKGICYWCNKEVLPGEGHFERNKNKWRTIHLKCVMEQRLEKEKLKNR